VASFKLAGRLHGCAVENVAVVLANVLHCEWLRGFNRGGKRLPKRALSGEFEGRHCDGGGRRRDGLRSNSSSFGDDFAEGQELGCRAATLIECGLIVVTGDVRLIAFVIRVCSTHPTEACAAMKHVNTHGIA